MCLQQWELNIMGESIMYRTMANINPLDGTVANMSEINQYVFELFMAW